MLPEMRLFIIESGEYIDISLRLQSVENRNCALHDGPEEGD
jgi:hypothetical protein